jgi:hypothetical protein
MSETLRTHEADAARWARIEAEVEHAFSGPTVELTDALWQEILTADGAPSPGSLAVPPGWKP